MPTYSVIHKKTGEEKDVFMKWEEFQEWLRENPDWSKMITAPAIVSNATGDILSKTPDGFKDHLNRIKKNSGKGNTIKT